jgi:dephospho-CoA kinase
MKDKRNILAIVGRDVSGKDTVGTYLEMNYGFTQVITGQLVRDYIAENNLGEPTRELMTSVANGARKQFGADYFVQRALHSEFQKLVLNGARAMGEIDAVRAAGGVVIAIEASVELRYQWAGGRGRTSDRVTFDEFVEQEKLSSSNKSVTAVNIDAMIASADYTIQNGGALSELFAKVDVLMAQIGVEKI